VERRGRHRAQVEVSDEGPQRVPLVVEIPHVWAELAAGRFGDVDAAIVAAGHDQRRPPTEVGEPHADTSVGSGASHGIEAETQWVIGSSWSLRWRRRGGRGKVV